MIGLESTVQNDNHCVTILLVVILESAYHVLFVELFSLAFKRVAKLQYCLSSSIEEHFPKIDYVCVCFFPKWEIF